MVHLRGNDQVRGQRRLVGLRAEPRNVIVRGHTDRPNDHLRGAGQDVSVVGQVCLGSFGSQSHVTKRTRVGDVHLSSSASEGTGLESIDVGDSVAGLDGPDHTDDSRLGEGRSDPTVDVTTFVGCRRIREDVVEALRVSGSPPGERHVREVRGDLHQGRTELGAMGDHHIMSVLGIAANRSSRILDDEGAVRDRQVDVTVQGVYRIDHALAERQIVGCTRSNDRHPQRTCVRSRGSGRRRGSGRSRGRGSGRLCVRSATDGHHADRTEQCEYPYPLLH